MPSRALVTGGGRGIGAGIARELADAGWHVTVTARSSEQVETVAREIGGTAVVGDVSKREDVERMLEAAGPIDLLVANAGIALWEDSWETDPDEWWHLFEVNVLGVYLTCRLALPGMIERGGGRIVITGSGASYLPGSTSGAYGASKAAVGRYGEVLAKQVEPHGVKVFVISPGLVNTEMTGDQFPDDAPVDAAELAPRLVARARVGPLRRARRPLPPRRARSARRARGADRPDPRRGPERAPPPPREPDALPAGGVRAAGRRVGRGARPRGIRPIVADADAAFGAESLWPADDWDSWRTPTPLKSLYVGAAGVIWGLDALARRGYAEPRPTSPPRPRARSRRGGASPT